MPQNETLSIKIQAKDSASPILRNISNNLSVFDKQINKVRQSLERFRSGINTALRYTTAMAGAISGVVSASTYFSAKVEKTFQNARTMLKMTEQQAKQMQESMKQLAVQSGKSLTELNEALYMLGSASIDAKDAIGVLSRTLKSAIAGNTDVVTTFQSAISIINAYGLSIEDLNSVYAMQFEAVKKGLLTYEQLASDFGKLIPSARSLGVSLREALAGYTALTTAGFSSAESSTAVAGAFQDLMQQAFKFKKLGIEIYDVNGEFIGLTKVIEQLRGKMKGLSDDEKRALLQELSLSETGSRALLTWINNFEKYEYVLNGIKGETEALNKAYELQTQSVSFLLDRLRASMEVLNITFFKAIRSGVVGVLSKIIAGIKALTDWINKNKEAVGETFWSFLRLVGVFTAGLIALKLFTYGAQILTFVLKPMNWLIMGIVWTIYELWKAFYNGKDYKKNIGGFISWIIDQFNKFMDFLKSSVFPAIQGIVDEMLSKTGKENAGLFDWIVAGFKWITDKLNLGEGLKTVWTWTVTGLDTVWEIIKFLGDRIWLGLSTAWNWIVSGINIVWDVIKTLGSKIWIGLSTAWNWTIKGLEIAWEVIKFLGEKIWKGLKTAWVWTVTGLSTVTGIIITLKEKIWKGLKTTWTWVVSGLTWVYNNIITPFTAGTLKVLDTTWSWVIKGLELIEQLKDYFNGVIQSTWEITVKFAGKIIDFFKKGAEVQGQTEEAKQKVIEEIENGKELNWFEKFMMYLGLYGFKGLGQWQEGGYTGEGIPSEVAGIVHKGEYVIPAWMVKKYPELVATLEQHRKKGYQEGGIVGMISSYLFGGKDNEGATLVKDVDKISGFVKEILKYVSKASPEMANNIKQIADKFGINLDTTQEVKKQLTPFAKGMEIWKSIANTLQKLQEKGTQTEQGRETETETFVDKLSKNFDGIINKVKEFGSGFKAGFEGFKQLSGTFDIGAILKGALASGAEGIMSLITSAGSGIMAVINMIIEALGPMLASLTNLVAVAQPITTIAQAMFNILGPIINQALLPFVQILQAFGTILGTMLLPLLEPFLGILQALAQVIAWAYNTIIAPIGKQLYIIFGQIANAFNILYNKVSDVIKKITFGIIDLGHRQVKGMEQIKKEAEEKFQKIDINGLDFEQGKAFSTEMTQEYMSNVTRSGPENVYNTIILNANDSFIMDYKSKFEDFLAETIQKLIDTGQIKFA